MLMILELIEKVEKNTKTYLKNYKKLKPEERDTVADEETNVRGDLKQCLELGDEKVALAVQTYELVAVMFSR